MDNLIIKVKNIKLITIRRIIIMIDVDIEREVTVEINITKRKKVVLKRIVITFNLLQRFIIK